MIYYYDPREPLSRHYLQGGESHAIVNVERELLKHGYTIRYRAIENLPPMRTVGCAPQIFRTGSYTSFVKRPSTRSSQRKLNRRTGLTAAYTNPGAGMIDFGSTSFPHTKRFKITSTVSPSGFTECEHDARPQISHPTHGSPASRDGT